MDNVLSSSHVGISKLRNHSGTTHNTQFFSSFSFLNYCIAWYWVCGLWFGNRTSNLSMFVQGWRLHAVWDSSLGAFEPQHLRIILDFPQIFHDGVQLWFCTPCITVRIDAGFIFRCHYVQALVAWLTFPRNLFGHTTWLIPIARRSTAVGVAAVDLGCNKYH